MQPQEPERARGVGAARDNRPQVVATRGADDGGASDFGEYSGGPLKKLLILLVPAGMLAAGFWYGAFGHTTPTGQPPLAAMDLAALRADFNRASDRPRLIVLLSPT